MSKLTDNTVVYFEESTQAVLSAKKIALLKEDETGKFATLDAMSADSAILIADDGVSLTIPVTALATRQGIVTGSEIYFKEDGTLHLAILPKVEPKPAKAAAPVNTGKRTGSYERPAAPTRDKH